ncbi:MAG: DUF4160 domain-containing protein [Betaproteobacteria bacterium]|nr:DUF4160 domain-containing protein [Betaproteobacteria bacterium]
MSSIFGAGSRIQVLDTKQHHLPHIHVEYAESEAIFQIPDGDLQYKLVQAWIALHSDELMADWKLAASGVTPYKIEPLR